MTTALRTVRIVSRIAVALAALTGLLALLAGVPWGLSHFIGWPLPDHLPTWTEVQATLSGPLTDTLLLNLLALIVWPVWLAFAIDVARCIPETLRGIRPVPQGPIHTLAAVLVSASMLSLLFGAERPQLEAPPDGPVLDADALALTAHDPTPVAQDGAVIVQEPHRGVHDSLWRIAERELGDGTRWPGLYEANKGKTQSDGRVLRDPNLIYPGWVLDLPERHRTNQPAPKQPAEAGTGRQDPAVGDRSTPERAAPDRSPTESQPSAPEAGPAVIESPNRGLDLVTGAFLSTVLAAAITAAMLAIRRRRERTYRPGSGERRPPPPPAPVIRALRIADDQRHLDLLEANSTDEQSPTDEGSDDHDTDGQTESVDIGVREGTTAAVRLAAVRGLGLTGPGAEAAARALLLNILATTTADVIIPTEDVVALLGSDLPTSQRLHIVPDLDAATTDLAQYVHSEPRTELSAVLVATVDQPDSRLQSVVDNGSDRGVAAVVLGPWPAGATVRVCTDGVVIAATPAIDDELRGTRLFHTDATDTRDIIEFLTAPAEDTDTIDDHHETAVPPQASPVAPPDLRENATGDPPWPLSVFGHFELVWRPAHAEPVTAHLSPKHRELLTFLAVHPSGSTRGAVREALWPDVTGKRPFNVLYATLSQIRKALDLCSDGHGDELIVHRGERIELNRNTVAVDYWEMADADHARRVATTDDERIAAWERITAAYTGKIDLDIRPLWLDGPREEAHRTAVDALSALAAHHQDNDPQRQLQLLEHARMLNPENEAIYRKIIEAQAALGLTDAISRTVGLLTHTLAETGQRPSSDLMLRARELSAQRKQTARR